MKKLFVLLVICIAVFVGMLITSFASEKIGDVNDDGKITAADARLVLRHSASLERLPDAVLANADADGNGRITAADARLILRVSANLDSFKEKNPTSELTTEKQTSAKPEETTSAKPEETTVVTAEESTSAQAEASSEEILSKYTEVMNHLKKNVAAYEKKEYQDLLDRDFGSATLNNVADGLFRDFLTSETTAELQMRDDYEQIPVIESEYGCLLTDASALKSASMSVEDGKTTITIVLNDEKNPKRAEWNAVQSPGNTGAVFSPATREEIIDAFGSGESLRVNDCDLLYHDCTATLVFDSETLEVESLKQVMNIDVDMNIKIMLVNKDCNFSLRNVMSIFNVNYDKDSQNDEFPSDPTMWNEVSHKGSDIVFTDDVKLILSNHYYIEGSMDTQYTQFSPRKNIKISVNDGKYYFLYPTEYGDIGIYHDGKDIFIVNKNMGIYTKTDYDILNSLGFDDASIFDILYCMENHDSATDVTSYTSPMYSGNIRYRYEYENNDMIDIIVLSGKLDRVEGANYGLDAITLYIKTISENIPEDMQPLNGVKSVSKTVFLASLVS